MSKRRKIRYFRFILPQFIGVLVFMIIPLGNVFRRSFTGMGNRLTLQNYRNVLENKSFKLALANNITFDLIGIAMIMVLSFVIAYLIYRRRNARLILVLMFPMAVPSNASAVVWNLLFRNTGMFKGFSGILFITFVYLWKYIGINVLLWCISLKNLSHEMIEAAALDGADRYDIIFKIMLPNLKKTAFILGILSFVNSFKIFREIYTLQGSYPDSHMYMIQHVFNNWFSALDISKLAAGSVLVILSVLMVSLLALLLTAEINQPVKEKKLFKTEKMAK